MIAVIVVAKEKLALPAVEESQTKSALVPCMDGSKNVCAQLQS
jgi:hypothetical protein